jgi:type I restriction enzyme S subunit
MKYEYINSGIEWIGEIPKHWGVTSIKKEFQVIPSNVDKKTEDDEDEVKLCNYVDVYYNDFITSDIDFMVASATENEINKFQLKLGDVLITKDSEDPFDIAVPALVKFTEEKLLCGYHLSMIRSINKRIEGSFLFWALKDEFIATQLWREACGVTRWAIASRHIKNSTIPFPPKNEQTAIAKYLDKACADIDRVVEIKRKQIENLQQQLKTQMSNWFAIGNNNKLKQTDSVVIPEIPKHWQLLKLKRVLEEKLKYGANESGDLDNTEDPRYIRITDFDDDGSLRDDTFKSLPLEVANDYLLNEGDILFARSGATVGKTFIFKNYEGVACYAGYLIKAVTLKYKMLPEYLYYYTKTKMYEDWKNLIFTQATIQNIGADKYQYLPVPVPPIEEQREILRKTDLLNENVKKAQSKIEKQIDILLKYKKSLIHEVVTGKKQVNGLTQEKKQMQTA